MTDRIIRLDGAANFRDIGGYPTASGREVRWRRVFRSGALGALTTRDHQLLSELGIRTVVDLRSAVERESQRGPFASMAVELAGLPPDPSVPLPVTVADGERRLAEVYRGLVDHGADAIGRVFATLGGVDALPALIHCHAGKDRTGVVVALLLDVLEVDRETVLDDYELDSGESVVTGEAQTFQRLVDRGYPEAAAAALVSACRPAMEALLDHVDTRFGGSVPFLVERAGVGHEEIERLRAELLAD